jgi:hypothetical protein
VDVAIWRSIASAHQPPRRQSTRILVPERRSANLRFVPPIRFRNAAPGSWQQRCDSNQDPTPLIAGALSVLREIPNAVHTSAIFLRADHFPSSSTPPPSLTQVLLWLAYTASGTPRSKDSRHHARLSPRRWITAAEIRLLFPQAPMEKQSRSTAKRLWCYFWLLASFWPGHVAIASSISLPLTIAVIQLLDDRHRLSFNPLLSFLVARRFSDHCRSRLRCHHPAPRWLFSRGRCTH